MGMSLYTRNNVINHLLRNTPMPSPNEIYVGLFTTIPTPEGGGTEVVGGGYVRMPVTFSAPNYGVSSNIEDIIFPVATANWGEVGWASLFDSPAEGNMIYIGNALAPKNIDVDVQLIIPAGKLVVTQE